MPLFPPTETLTVAAWLQSPPLVQRRVEDLTAQRFIADEFFATGPNATGGSVQFSQLTSSDLFLNQDVESIRPAAEYPILTDTRPTLQLASVEKWGGRVWISDEDRDRDRWDVFERETRKLANTIVRKVNAVAVTTLDAAPLNTLVGSDWTAASLATMIANILNAEVLIDTVEFGYEETNRVLALNYVQANELDIAIASAAPSTLFGEAFLDNEGRVQRIGRIRILRSGRVAAGTGYLATRQMVGSQSDEVPLRTLPYRDEDNDTTFIKGSRRTVPYVTDPKAATKITGI